MRLTGLCLVAAFVLAAVTAGAASATDPALYECAKLAKNPITKKYEGKFTDKKCSVHATKEQEEKGEVNKYEFQEWNLAAKKSRAKKFKSKGKHPANLAVPGVGTVSCTDTKDEGVFTGPKTAGHILVTFTGCKISLIACQSKGAAAGEIKTPPLKAQLGYLEAFHEGVHLVGIDISSEEPGGVNAEIICGSEAGEYTKLRVEGSAVGEVVPPYNVFTNVAKLSFERLGEGQEYKKLEGLPEDVLHVRYCAVIGHTCEVGTEEIISTEETFNEGKGETLYLKA